MTIEKERLIYTSGTFKIDDTLARCRRVIIRASVLRLPFSAVYRNERSNPSKYFLGYVSVFAGEYVSSVFALEFEQQIVFVWDNLASQVYARVICDAINTNLYIQAVRNTLPPVGGVPLIPGDPGTFPGCPYNFIKFKLEPGARILVTGIGEELETCPGGEFQTTVPDLAPPPAPYPLEQARDEDPERSPPEIGELPGDTAPATAEDPDSSLSSLGTWTISWKYSQGGSPTCPFVGQTDVGFFAGSSNDEFTIAVRDGSYQLYQNGVEVGFAIGVNCVPSFDPSPVFTPN